MVHIRMVWSLTPGSSPFGEGRNTGFDLRFLLRLAKVVPSSFLYYQAEPDFIFSTEAQPQPNSRQPIVLRLTTNYLLLTSRTPARCTPARFTAAEHIGFFYCFKRRAIENSIEAFVDHACHLYDTDARILDNVQRVGANSRDQ